MTMYYLHGIGPSKDAHVNFPAANAQSAYDVFKQEMGAKVTVAEITELFTFDVEDQTNLVRPN
jgi:hypothetical protein